MDTPGIFNLRNVTDLLAKLEYDFGRLQRSQANAYVAFDFFVTAEHMLDWQYPGNVNKELRTRERQSEVLLQVCSHIAAGAKHFEVEAPYHQSVIDSGLEGGGFDPVGFQNDAFQVGRLTIRLEGNAGAAFGSPIEAIALASSVLAFWRSRIVDQPSRQVKIES